MYMDAGFFDAARHTKQKKIHFTNNQWIAFNYVYIKWYEY